MAYRWRWAVWLLAAALGLASCGQGSRVIFTKGLAAEELFSLGEERGSKAQVELFMGAIEGGYASAYGQELWQTGGGVQLEMEVRERALEALARTKAMALLAEEEGLTLEAAQLEAARTAASAYVKALEEQGLAGEEAVLDADQAQALYRQMALAQRIYAQLIQDIQPEISDDEARTVVCALVFLPKEERDKGQYHLQTMQEIRRQALEAGADVAVLFARHNQAPEGELRLRRGEADPRLEEAAFALAQDEISQVLVLDSGYYLLKCISTQDVEETQRNKEALLARRRQEAFLLSYEGFWQGLDKQWNAQLWEQGQWQARTAAGQAFFAMYALYLAPVL